MPETRRPPEGDAAAALPVERRRASPSEPSLFLRLPVLGVSPRLRWLGRVAVQTYHRWKHDRCTVEAGALAYKTALGLVPLASVAFMLLRAGGMLDERSAFIEFFADSLFPSEDARATVSQAIIGFADNIESGILGPLGLGILIAVVFLLCHDIESFWNRVWSSPRPRPLLSKFFLFYTLATLVPFLLAVSLYHTARFWRGGVVGYFAPLGWSFIALLLANKLLPVVRVRVRFAALGAGVSSLLYELAKVGFARYAAVALKNYRSIYGALGLVPLVFVWIYVTWLTVLLGAEVSHAAQRLGALEAGDRRRRNDQLWEVVSGATAARVMVEIARRFADGERPPGVGDLAERFALPEEVTSRIVARLRERGLVLEAGGDLTGWLPARPPSQIRLAEVLRTFRPGDPEPTGDALAKLLEEWESFGTSHGEVTLDALLAKRAG